MQSIAPIVFYEIILCVAGLLAIYFGIEYI
jgi:hypothetical protein